MDIFSLYYCRVTVSAKISFEATAVVDTRDIIQDRTDRIFIPPIIDSETNYTAVHYPLSLCLCSRRISISIAERRSRRPSLLLLQFRVVVAVGRKKCDWIWEAASRLGNNTMSLNDRWRAGDRKRDEMEKKADGCTNAYYYYWHTRCGLGCTRTVVKGNSYFLLNSLSLFFSFWLPQLRDKSGTVSHNRGESLPESRTRSIDLSLSIKPPLSGCSVLQQVWFIWILCGTNDRLLLSDTAPRDNITHWCIGHRTMIHIMCKVNILAFSRFIYRNFALSLQLVSNVNWKT